MAFPNHMRGHLDGSGVYTSASIPMTDDQIAKVSDEISRDPENMAYRDEDKNLKAPSEISLILNGTHTLPNPDPPTLINKVRISKSEFIGLFAPALAAIQSHGPLSPSGAQAGPGMWLLNQMQMNDMVDLTSEAIKELMSACSTQVNPDGYELVSATAIQRVLTESDPQYDPSIVFPSPMDRLFPENPMSIEDSESAQAVAMIGVPS